MREPEFDEVDRAWLMALAMCRRLTCPGCGEWLPDSTRLDASHYDADPAPYLCGACDALTAVQRAWSSDYPDKMHATRWLVKRRR